MIVFVFRADDRQTREERLREAALLAGYGKKADGSPAAPGADLWESDIWRIARTKRGKPYFPGQPGLHFSISHSGSFWVCVFSGQAVGIDIQKHVRRKGESARAAACRLGRMAERFFHPAEAEWVLEESYERFFRIWTAKESFVKYTGEGIDTNFGNFCLVPEEWKTGKYSPAEQESLSWEAEGVRFYSRRLLGGYTLCVCSQETEMSVEIRWPEKISDNYKEKRDKIDR
ncbi:MAG: 4'-phosphopantetheinyl transferase superfamily protein [Lachnospiraceae bacterium]|nr:4'-phosphopantetheinyl transferase superfamily protein [Lachnospiraceae bacterium]